MKDLEPRKEIVDIDSFTAYIKSTVAAIRTNPSLKIEPFENSLPKNNINITQDIIEQDIQEAVKDGLIREKIVIGDIPWDSIPESLQGIIALQYPAATLNEPKIVNIELDTLILQFKLISRNSSDDVDHYGDIYNPYGLRLVTAAEEMFIAEKGNFVIQTTPLSQQVREDALRTKQFEGKPLTDEENEWLTNNLRKHLFREDIQVIPSTLLQLQDIASVIKRFKDNAILFTDSHAGFDETQKDWMGF